VSISTLDFWKCWLDGGSTFGLEKLIEKYGNLDGLDDGRKDEADGLMITATHEC
jgi:hypothetical protein